MNKQVQDYMTKQLASEMVADMYEQAKSLLKHCEELSDENGLHFSYESLYEELSGNCHVDWNSSNCY